jgi:hypothetical protein
MVQHFVTLVLLLGNPVAAEASTLMRSCEKLVNGNPELARKCVQHADYFELNAKFVDSCTAFHSDPDTRTRCLKSGATQEIFNLCRETGWSTSGTLTCLRSYPTQASLSACKKIALAEEAQIRCLRLGRELPQLAACTAIGHDEASRFSCLQLDVPAHEALACNSRHRSREQKYSCLENVVAEREGEYWRDQTELRGRSLASEKPVSKPPKMRK